MKQIFFLIIALLYWETTVSAQSVTSREYRDSYIYAYIKSDTYQGGRADYVYIHNLTTTPVQVTLLENVVKAQFGRTVAERVIEEKVTINAEKTKRVSRYFGNHINYEHCYVTAFKILTVRSIEKQTPPSRQAQQPSQPSSYEKRVFKGDVDFFAEVGSNTGNDVLTKCLSFNDFGIVVLEENTWNKDGSWTGERVMTTGKYYILGNTIYVTWDAFEYEIPKTEQITISQDWNSIMWGSLYLRKN